VCEDGARGLEVVPLGLHLRAAHTRQDLARAQKIPKVETLTHSATRTPAREQRVPPAHQPPPNSLISTLMTARLPVCGPVPAETCKPPSPSLSSPPPRLACMWKWPLTRRTGLFCGSWPQVVKGGEVLDVGGP
jgi:hypothetical protein